MKAGTAPLVDAGLASTLSSVTLTVGTILDVVEIAATELIAMNKAGLLSADWSGTPGKLLLEADRI